MKLGTISADDFLAPRGREQQPTLVDRVRLDIRKEVVQDAAASLLSAPSPDNAAQSNHLARRFGIDAPTIDGALDEFKKRKQIEDFSTMALQYAGLSAWASNPRNAAVAVDDDENLGMLGNVWQGIKNVGSSLKAGYYNVEAGAGGLNAGVTESFVSDYKANWENPDSFISMLGLVEADKALMTPVLDILEDFQNWNERASAQSRAKADAARPKVNNWFVRDLLSGVEQTSY